MAITLDELRCRFSPDEVSEPGTEQYNKQSQPWSLIADKRPSLVITPSDLQSMSTAVKLLCESDFDFAVRNTGTGSVSANDIIISTHGFRSISYNESDHVLTIGSGLAWGEVDTWMEANVPGYSVVGARCSWVGVAGSSLAGGLSWLSNEFGMISDPQNLLDMQVVLGDGRVVWATREPDLMWALRGGGGNFGVVTALRLQARPYPTKIFSGVVTVPYSSLREASRVVSKMASRTSDTKLAMHILNLGPGMGSPDQGSKPDIAILLYDAHGTKHAMSEAGFKHILNITGATNLGTQELTIKQVNAQGESFRDYQGNSHFWLSAPLLDRIEEDTLVRVWKWYEDSVDEFEGFGSNSNVLLEFMLEKAYDSSGGRTATGWPHSGRRHVMQLVLGCKQSLAPPDLETIAIRRLANADVKIAGTHKTGEFHAAFLHEWNDMNEVYKENLPKLQEIKKRYDPKNRFNKGPNLFKASAAPIYLQPLC